MARLKRGKMLKKLDEYWGKASKDDVRIMKLPTLDGRDKKFVNDMSPENFDPAEHAGVYIWWKGQEGEAVKALYVTADRALQIQVFYPFHVSKEIDRKNGWNAIGSVFMEWIMRKVGETLTDEEGLDPSCVRSIVFICVSDKNFTDSVEMKKALDRPKIEIYEQKQPQYGIIGAAKNFMAWHKNMQVKMEVGKGKIIMDFVGQTGSE